jgi:predicted Zn-dependent protease
MMKTFYHQKISIPLLISLFLFCSIISYPQQPAHQARPVNKSEYDSSNQGYLFRSGKIHREAFKYRLKTNNKLISPPFRDSSENYFHINKTDSSLWNGRHWDKHSYPLRIYIRKSTSKYYKPVYRDYVEYAFKLWKKADNRITSVFVSTSDSADIIITFVDNLIKEYDDNYIGLTNTDYNKDKVITTASIQLSLLKFGNKSIADGEMKATIIHETGHVLGLGHSDNDKDIMYPYIDPTWDKNLDFNDLSSGDYLAIRSLTDLGFK